jgi:glutamate racemase
MSESPGPIGVFDSGVGGLSVVGALLRRYPCEQFLYVADQAHVPYGGRPLPEVCGFACGISAFLAEAGCRAIVMGCNISSATALPSVSASLAPLPVLGMIAPAARRAVLLSHPSGGEEEKLPSITPPLQYGRGMPRPYTPSPHAQRPIGVLATVGTVQSGAYTRQIQALDPTARVLEVACPKFVPLVEAEATEGEEAVAAARAYLIPLAEAGCRTIILGCTHYPFILPTLHRVSAMLFSESVTYVDPADEIADALRAALPDLGGKPPVRRHLLFTTGEVDAFRAQARYFLPDIDVEVQPARWSHGGRLIPATLRTHNTITER